MHGKPEGLKGGGTTSLIQSTRTLSRQSSNLPAQNRALKDQARFLRQIQVAQKSLAPPEMTYLESRSVRLPTLKDYTNRRNIFLKWCQVHGMETLTEHQLDQALVEYLEFLFSEGMKIDSGIRIHAAMRFFNPALGRPSSGSLARTVKALKGWSHAAPPMQRLPLPIEVLGAIIGLLIQKNLMEIGIRLLLQFICYLRPGECSNLTVKQLVPPQHSVGMRFQFWALLLHPVEEGVPGKTNVYDATVLIDTELWLSPFFKKLIEAKGQDDPLWTHPHEMVVNSFRTCVEELGLTQLGTCLYTLRHGGATHDIIAKRRSMLEVKQRGRWAADSSLKRYVKLARLQSEMNKIPSHILTYGRNILDTLPHLISQSRPNVPPFGTQTSPGGCSRKVILPRTFPTSKSRNTSSLGYKK